MEFSPVETKSKVFHKLKKNAVQYIEKMVSHLEYKLSFMKLCALVALNFNLNQDLKDINDIPRNLS